MPCDLEYDDSRKGVWFSVRIEKNDVVAFISTRVLINHFEATHGPENQIERCAANKGRIDEVVIQKYIDGFPIPITVSSDDF